jgi:hypothetical protein
MEVSPHLAIRVGSPGAGGDLDIPKDIMAFEKAFAYLVVVSLWFIRRILQTSGYIIWERE